MNDIFPSTFSSFARPIKHPVSLRGFRAIYRKFKTLRASEILLEKNKIHFIPISGCKQLMKYFLKTGKDSYFPRYYHPRDLKWNDVASCLKSKGIFTLDNSYGRICFKYGNTYLTDSNFTFGLRYVNEGTNHIYQTTNAPLLIYMLPTPSIKSTKLDKFDFDLAYKKNCIFNASDQNLYNLHLLEPNRVYKIPDLIYYIIITTQRTLFSVDIIKSQTLLPFSLCRNPQDFKNYNKKKGNMHKGPWRQLATSNHAKSGYDESTRVSLGSSAEKNNPLSPVEMYGITAHKKSYASPSSSCDNHVQHNAELDKNVENLTSVVSSTSSEAGPDAYSLQLERKVKVVQLTRSEMLQRHKILKEQIFGHPTDYFIPTAEDGTVPLDLSCKCPQVNDRSLGLDFDFDFNEELLELSYDEVLDFFENV